MKKYLFIALFVLQTIVVMAQTSRFKDNETLSVWATSGLNMRDKPHAKATKLISIPYGAKVVVQPNIGVKIPFEVEEFKGFTVKGLWLLVKYGDKEGFVFDGFLSRLPAPKKADSLRFEGYLTSNFKKIGQRYNCISYLNINVSEETIAEKNCDDTTKLYCSYSQKYDRGIVFSKNSCNDVGDDVIEIQNVTLYEGLALVKWFYSIEKTEITINARKSEIIFNSSIKDGGYGCDYSIEKIGNKIVIKGRCSC